MVLDMVTGEEWTPDTDTVRDFYNLGRWTDDTHGGVMGESTTQAEREGEFNRWLQPKESAEVLVNGLVLAAASVESTDDYMDFADTVLRELGRWADRG